MNRADWVAILCLGFALASTNVAGAQDRGGVSGGWGGVALLLHPEVQKELKLDEPQLEKTRALAYEMREKQRTLFAGLEGMAGEERSKKAQEIAGLHAEEGIKALGGLLKPEQFARFQQVDLQQRGAAALTDPKVARALKLTPEQGEKLGTIIDRSVLQMRETPSRARGDRKVTLEKIQAIRKDTDAQAVALLTEAQKLDWKKMTGEPFEMSSVLRPGR